MSRLLSKQVLQEETDLAETVEEETGDEKEPEKPSRAVQQRRWSVVAQRILDEALVAGDDEETFNRLKRASDDLVSCDCSSWIPSDLRGYTVMYTATEGLSYICWVESYKTVVIWLNYMYFSRHKLLLRNMIS